VAGRIDEHAVLGAAPKRREIRLSFDGKPIVALEGDSIASALLANGVHVIRLTGEGPRGFFCGAGHCYECRVIVDGVPGRRACLVPAREGMIVEPALAGSCHGD
jgi:sarcosine oxidase, subunit alpha